MTAFVLSIIGVLYILTARILLGSLENILSKHPLFIYSVIVLIGLVLAFRLSGKAVQFMLWVLAIFMGLYLWSLKG
ncbi:MAG: hypothetical protein E7013_01310 [Alphaproteobacteria bacterium]|nr:hypothetical protein [Alphaproteobacteria bacterium]